jgi:hypothetical protein
MIRVDAPAANNPVTWFVNFFNLPRYLQQVSALAIHRELNLEFAPPSPRAKRMFSTWRAAQGS